MITYIKCKTAKTENTGAMKSDQLQGKLPEESI
jgi:hypothetical protein